MNLAGALKSEIARVARKEVRAETIALKKASSGHRSDLAALKRRIQLLETQMRSVQKKAAKPLAVDAAPVAEDGATNRFSAKGFAANRRRLGLTAAECGLLIGASALSIYKWESGTRPRAKFMPAIAALRHIGKKEAAARLENLRAGAA